MDKKLIEFELFFAQYSIQGQKFTSDCNALTIKNDGQFPFTINSSLSIAPGSYFSMPGNQFEIDRTQYEVFFSAEDVSNGTQRCTVIRKLYKDTNRETAKFNSVYGHL